MEKYILITAIILFFTQKVYWYITVESMDLITRFQISRGKQYDIGLDGVIMNITKFISYLLFITSGIMYIIKFL